VTLSDRGRVQEADLPVRLARDEDLPRVGEIIATAFEPDNAIDHWMVPNRDTRAQIMPRYFDIICRDAVSDGTIYLAPDATAVWFSVDEPREPEEPSGELLDLVGEHAGRMAELESALHRAHRDLPPHEYLSLMAVLPAVQGQGKGSAFLQVHHQRLDEQGRPAYLDAASLDSRRLYLRHGYRDHGEPFSVGEGGPLMWPMWRPPGGANGSRRV
jgi:GNAT superfamily N-acetyltransferase